tara:strand:+ start:786 stop:1082 length:297 start_codon:yes stop_codon:yes gene_type:complete
MIIEKAILEINPNASFIVSDNDINTIEWTHGTEAISVSEIQAKMSEIETRDAHIAPRQRAYPSIQEQLDMMYKDQMNDTTTWKDAITKVKTDNPKASE